MREIKFRAWDGEKMHTENVCVISGEFAIDEGKLCHNFEYDNLIGMQYTGLKDRNGVEIYCGDIIDDHVGIGVVVWWQKNAAFKISYAGENKGRGKWFADYLDSEFKTVEVIGNIHQNSELLES